MIGRPLLQAIGLIDMIVANGDVPIWSVALNKWVAGPQVGGLGGAAWGGITGDLADQLDLLAALDDKADAGHTHTGVYEPANANLQAHVASAHAPSDAQKNSDITKAEIEAKLTGVIATHTHAGGAGDVVGPASAVDARIAVFSGTTGKLIADGGETVAALLADIGQVATDLGLHQADTANPHAVTAAQAGLGNVDNTSDAAKPVSTATQTALNLKAPLASPTFTGTVTVPAASFVNAKLADMATKTYKGRTAAGTGVPEDVPVATLKTDLTLVKGDVGLGNVDNTSDVNKPISTATQTALDGKSATGHTHATLAGMSWLTFNGVAATDVRLRKGAGAYLEVRLGDDSGYAPAVFQNCVSIDYVLAGAGGTDPATGGFRFNSAVPSVSMVCRNVANSADLTMIARDGANNITIGGETKQATLVSATNIKTINGSSVLGAGDLVVSGSTPDIVSQKQAPAAGTTIAAGYSAYIPVSFEVLAGLTLEVGLGAAFEIG